MTQEELEHSAELLLLKEKQIKTAEELVEYLNEKYGKGTVQLGKEVSDEQKVRK